LVANKLILRFSATLVEQPLIYRLVKDYDLILNIMKADISPQNEGYVIMEVQGTEEHYQQGIRFLEELGVQVKPLNKTIVRNEAKCIQCGACIAVCSVGALCLKSPHMEVGFDVEKCVVCGSCTQFCPYKAMEVDWGLEVL